MAVPQPPISIIHATIAMIILALKLNRFLSSGFAGAFFFCAGTGTIAFASDCCLLSFDAAAEGGEAGSSVSVISLPASLSPAVSLLLSFSS